VYEKHPSDNVLVCFQLRIFPASSETPGIYTCAVTYNGMTRLVVQYHVCITRTFTVPLKYPHIECIFLHCNQM